VSTGHAKLHFTSAYDPIIQRWDLVLMSIIFGTTKAHYKSHWLSLFESFGDNVNHSLDTLKNQFSGVTIDWSQALGQGFIDAFVEHAAHNRWQIEEIEVDEVLSCNPKKIGAKPTCKGCNNVIQYDVARISNHFKLKNQIYPITHQYHCNASYLKRHMDKETIKRLVEKRWPQKDMENIVE
jgi:hypothetical protein